MITAAQIRAARALIGLSVEDLAAATALSPAAIGDAEDAGGSGGDTVARILRAAFEDRGVVFLFPGDEDGGGAGVRLKRAADGDDGTRPEHLNATNDD